MTESGDQTDKRAASREERTTVEALASAICLAGLAGWVDATGFIHFHGLFASFMSGNSTQAAVHAAAHELGTMLEFARTILLFVIGVAVAELVAAPSGRWRRPLVLGLEAVVLGGTVLTVRFRLDEILLASGLAFAMGVQNAALHKAGKLTVGLTYVTGTLVQVGRRSAEVLRGEQPWHAPLPFLGLWLGLVTGGFAGALASARSLLTALSAATGLCCLLFVWALITAIVFRPKPDAA